MWAVGCSVCHVIMCRPKVPSEDNERACEILHSCTAPLARRTTPIFECHRVSLHVGRSGKAGSSQMIAHVPGVTPLTAGSEALARVDP